MSLFVIPLLLSTLVLCDITPLAPGPGESFNAGSQCTLKWSPDASGTWKNMTIHLMSGPNNNMIHVTDVVVGLDGTDPSLSPYSWICPQVNPYSAIYFYEFTNNDPVQNSEPKWTSRFTIASPTGNSVQPENSKQSNGDSTPWGNGAMVHSSGVTAQSVPSLQGAESDGRHKHDTSDSADDDDGSSDASPTSDDTALPHTMSAHHASPTGTVSDDNDDKTSDAAASDTSTAASDDADTAASAAAEDGDVASKTAAASSAAQTKPASVHPPHASQTAGAASKVTSSKPTPGLPSLRAQATVIPSGASCSGSGGVNGMKSLASRGCSRRDMITPTSFYPLLSLAILFL